MGLKHRGIPGPHNAITDVPGVEVVRGGNGTAYEAVVQATEEAVANALIANEDMTGRDGHRSPALPRHRLAEILARAGR